MEREKGSFEGGKRGKGWWGRGAGRHKAKMEGVVRGWLEWEK